jgi:hypothetical protein
MKEHPVTTAAVSEAEARSHHRYSPSTLQNREACPCYTGRDGTHVRAIAGTLAHGVVETGKDDNKLGDEDALAAAECLDFVESRRQLMIEAREKAEKETALCQCGDLFYGGDHDNHTPVLMESEPFPEVQELKEIELAVDDCKFPDGSTSTTSGYVDRCLIDHTETYAELFDWKFGAWAVEPAETNLQGIAYVLGLFRHFPKLKAIRFFFRQPLIDYNSDFLFTRDQVPALYLRVQTVVARARAAKEAMDKNPLDFSTANVVVPACNFCGNIGRCPKVTAFACQVGAKFHPVEIPAEISPNAVLTDRDTKFALRLAQVVKVWAESFRAQVTDRVIRGDADLPDDQMIQTQSRRELINKAAFKTTALRYLSEEEYQNTLEVAFGEVEGAISNKAERGTKKATVEQFQAELESAGATRKGDPFSFLRAKTKTKTS